MEFIIGLVVFIADIWAIVNVIQAPAASTGAKVLWVLLIILLPLIGLLVWLVVGPRGVKAKRV